MGRRDPRRPEGRTPGGSVELPASRRKTSTSASRDVRYSVLMSAALEGGEVGSRIATLPDVRRWPSRVRARQLLVRYTRRLGVALLLALGVALMLRSEWTQGFGSVLGRTATLALAGVLAFSISEQWPRRLPRWLPRWVLQVVATGAAMPSTTLVVYILSTEAGAPPFWQDRDRMEGFMTLTFLGILLAPWMALGALVRARESFARDQALAFELERSHLEREAVEARLRLLEAQVAPHFLFNTLANIQALVDAGSPRASAVLRSLVVYLRAAVPELGAPARTVARELDLVRAYLELMQMRMPDRLRFELSVEEAALVVHCPSTALLTLVENAVRHGIDPAEEGGLISIQIESKDGLCLMRVSDTGAGFKDGVLNLGTGLSTLSERLRLMFGENALLRITAREPRGVCAELQIPVNEEAK